ncbi:hypothetical protein CHLNCDRAFT_136721 [Acetobacter orientalis]|uniref:Uncharacterized protein n=1 Tax=Acetobacter orientalis TaxID=146474 RepID=A0A2Z5ZFG6_9PROT|nr:hypothetical protein CHLNCDRAFT_136721 [Acetobacter orientalis]
MQEQKACALSLWHYKVLAYGVCLIKMAHKWLYLHGIFRTNVMCKSKAHS